MVEEFKRFKRTLPLPTRGGEDAIGGTPPKDPAKTGSQIHPDPKSMQNDSLLGSLNTLLVILRTLAGVQVETCRNSLGHHSATCLVASFTWTAK